MSRGDALFASGEGCAGKRAVRSRWAKSAFAGVPSRVFSKHRAKAVGFALFMAWCYHTFFLSALGVAREPLWCDVWVWEFVEGPLAVAGVAFAIAFTRFPLLLGAPARFFCLGSSVVGSVLIGVGHAQGAVLSSVTAVGEALCGISLALFVISWGRWVSSLEEDEAEWLMVASFGAGAALCILLLVIGGVARIAASALLAVGASLFASFEKVDAAETEKAAWRGTGAPRAAGVASDGAPKRSGGRSQGASRSQTLTLFLLYGLLWFLFSYFRIMAAPSQTGGDELMLPFAAAFLLVGAGLGACLLYSSHVNFTLVYRWALPLVVVGCGVLHVVDTEFGRSLAYLINFVALFGCQAICWIASAKHVRRTGVSPVLFFGGVVAAEGCGVTLGAVVGLWLSSGATGGQAAGFSLLIVGAVLLVTMLVGFKPCWISGSSQGVFSGDTSREATPEEGECPQGAAKAGDLALEGAFNGGCDEALQRLFARKARILGDAYGLTKREVEITAFLLAGRNRPYIRDELVISLHTVHTHVRNILGKCGVHSQQELIDLAHAAEVGRPALDMPAPPSRMGEASPAEARVSPPAPSRRLLTI